MPKKMTKAEAIRDFRILYKTFTNYRRGDVVAKRTEWNDYTDALCKEGLITDNQYNNVLGKMAMSGVLQILFQLTLLSFS